MDNVSLIVMICNYFNCGLSLAEALLESAKANGTLDDLIQKITNKQRA